MKMKTVKIDSEKLKKELQKRGLINQEVSEAIGFNRDYITDCLRSGQISEVGAKRLLEEYYIKYENIEPEIVKKPEPVQEPAQVAMQMQTGLGKDDIEDAFYSALVKYFGNPRKLIEHTDHAENFRRSLQAMEKEQ